MYKKVTVIVIALALAVPVYAGASCPLITDVALPTASDSGVWTGPVLNLVDVFGARILRYGKDGKLRERVDMRDIAGLRAFEPRALGRSDSGLVLQLNRGNFSNVNARFQPTAMIDLKAADYRASATAAGGGVVDRVYNAWATAGDNLVFCADVQRGNNWSSGYLVAPLANPNSYTFLDERSIQDPELVYCRTGMHYIAATSYGDVYILVGKDDDGDGQEDATVIRHWTFTDGKLGSSGNLPARFGARPTLGNYVTSDDFAATMRTLELATMPAGLFVSDDGSVLYVLERAPTRNGTRWTLEVVDATNGARLGEATLPSTSSHLTVVPGPDEWAFLERSPALGFRDFASEGLRFVPTSEIRSIADGGNVKLCN